MIYIYKITNKINNKIYIGSTIHPSRREYEHFYYAFLPSSNSYYYPLQCAIRKYGKINFIFEVIEEIEDEKASEREKYFIINLNALANDGWGYNQTLFTECAIRDPNIIQQHREKLGTKCALVDENNKILEYYLSYGEASKKLYKENCSSVIKKICEGELHSQNGMIFRHLNDDGEVIVPYVKTRKRKKQVCGISIKNSNDIVFYDSISEASRREKISRESISKCVNGSTRYSNVGGRIWRHIEGEVMITK